MTGKVAPATGGSRGIGRAYASGLAGEGIAVNAIAAAPIETDMIAAIPNARPDRNPVGRLGTVGEAAAVVVMPACNGFNNGPTINVNGGLYPG